MYELLTGKVTRRVLLQVPITAENTDFVFLSLKTFICKDGVILFGEYR